jgi:hypothetical protein
MESGKPSKVPGDAEVTFPGETQQRIGVTVGQVERAPLKMSVFRNAFVGQHVAPQTELYVVADLSTVWVQAQVHGYELPPFN